MPRYDRGYVRLCLRNRAEMALSNGVPLYSALSPVRMITHFIEPRYALQ